MGLFDVFKRSSNKNEKVKPATISVSDYISTIDNSVSSDITEIAKSLGISRENAINDLNYYANNNKLDQYTVGKFTVKRKETCIQSSTDNLADFFCVKCVSCSSTNPITSKLCEYCNNKFDSYNSKIVLIDENKDIANDVKVEFFMTNEFNDYSDDDDDDVDDSYNSFSVFYIQSLDKNGNKIINGLYAFDGLNKNEKCRKCKKEPSYCGIEGTACRPEEHIVDSSYFKFRIVPTKYKVGIADEDYWYSPNDIDYPVKDRIISSCLNNVMDKMFIDDDQVEYEYVLNVSSILNGCIEVFSRKDINEHNIPSDFIDTITYYSCNTYNVLKTENTYTRNIYVLSTGLDADICEAIHVCLSEVLTGKNGIIHYPLTSTINDCIKKTALYSAIDEDIENNINIKGKFECEAECLDNVLRYIVSYDKIDSSKLKKQFKFDNNTSTIILDILLSEGLIDGDDPYEVYKDIVEAFMSCEQEFDSNNLKKLSKFLPKSN